MTGEQKQVTDGEVTRYVGFVPVAIQSKLAINPSREELNKLLGKEDEEGDKIIEYLGEDKEGNPRLRMTFWLYSEEKDKYFPYSFSLTDKEVKSKETGTTQWVNNTCDTTWVDEEENLPQWFTHFLEGERGSEKVIGKKKYRKSILGESELAIFLKAWLGRAKMKAPTADFMVDMKRLFKEDYSELREMVDSIFDTPFVALLGVRTDEADSSKQYQQVSGKAFLPSTFYKYILKGNKFPSGYAQNVWDSFLKKTTGKYPFNAYFELVPICEYNKENDPAVSETTVKKAEDVTPVNPKF